MAKFNIEALKKAISESITWTQVVVKLYGDKRSYKATYCKKIAIRHSIPFNHFVSGVHLYNTTKASVLNNLLVLCDPKNQPHSSEIRKRLISEGRKEPRCERCGLDQWMGNVMPLDLHHVNGLHHDNRFENLEIICPNCHALETRKPKKNPKPLKEYKCNQCGMKRSGSSAGLCRACYSKTKRRRERPNMDTLKNEAEVMTYRDLAKKYNTTPPTIREWLFKSFPELGICGRKKIHKKAS